MPRIEDRRIREVVERFAPGAVASRYAIPPDRIESNPWAPGAQLDAESMDHLTEQIITRGMREPLLARPLSGHRYQLLAGDRQLEAARRIGLQSVPVLVLDVDERTGIAIALVDAVTRTWATPWEISQGLAELVDTLQQLGEESDSVRVAALLDYTPEWVERLLPIAEQLTPGVLELAGLGVHDMNTLSEEELLDAATSADPAERARKLREAHGRHTADRLQQHE